MIHALSFHSLYRCGRSGACCTAGWPIPIEADRLARVRAAVAERRLTGRTRSAAVTTADSVDVLAMDARGCAFFDPADRRCAIHHALGHDALPLACRQFPRVCVRDPRGTSITLSHYCPTAARLLESDAPVAVVSTPPAFPAGGEYVGLDATGVLPPLLRAGVLMDWEAWWACEQRAVVLLGNSAAPPREALAQLAGAVHRLQAWRPETRPLMAAVDAAFRSPSAAPERLADPDALVEAARAAMPAALRPAGLPQGPRPRDAVINRFLAAHAFASWAVFGPGGLDAWRRSIETALALLDAGAGVREADLWLRHLAA